MCLFTYLCLGTAVQSEAWLTALVRLSLNSGSKRSLARGAGARLSSDSGLERGLARDAGTRACLSLDSGSERGLARSVGACVRYGRGLATCIILHGAT